MKSNNIIAKTARLESASELLSAEMGRISKKIIEAQKSSPADASFLTNLEEKLFSLEMEKRSLSIDDDARTQAIIKKYGIKDQGCDYASGF